MAHQPVLGPGDAGVIEGSLQRLDLGEEVVVDLLVIGEIREACLGHHALLILEVVLCDLVQLADERGTFWVLGAIEDALKDGLVLSIDVVVHHTEGFIPHIGFWNLERHDVGCNFGWSLNKFYETSAAVDDGTCRTLSIYSVGQWSIRVHPHAWICASAHVRPKTTRSIHF
ncbi:hypothetical protein NP493_53g08062 [Ridgeia piscesae]|uniref:Uncharacterized protein n=1 Tax=Ridgeia piscesae TaxID=27915 RepID=A0AAD9PAV9_RIDPI|nr:hypothetical protein NP493_53g08062 [Ridgeia piscesae]